MFLNSRSFFKSVLQPLFAVLFSLLVLPWANAVSYPTVTAMPVAIPDPGSVNITFNVSGQTAPITNISVDVNVVHAWGGDVRLELIAPNGTALDLVRSPGGPRW
jgi:subtilisin-like proprotein convertase family protein